MIYYQELEQLIMLSTSATVEKYLQTCGSLTMKFGCPKQGKSVGNFMDQLSKQNGNYIFCKTWQRSSSSLGSNLHDESARRNALVSH
jgi:hypothetical protein